MPKPIRPSEVIKFSRCPTLWYREDVEQWRKPGEGFVLEREFGTWVHAGMAAYWNILLGGWQGKSPELTAISALEKDWPESTDYSKEGAITLLDKVVSKAIGWCQTNLEKTIPLEIEQPLGDGDTTPDLVAREAGDLVVLDYKTHYEVLPDRRHYRLEGPERSHQFNHYSWAISQKYAEPVTLFRAIHIFALPSIKIMEASFVPDPEAQKEWLRQASRKWYVMEQMKVEPAQVYRREEGCLQFGDKHPCPQWEGCWTCHGQPDALKQFYVKG